MKFLLDWIDFFDDKSRPWRGDEHVFRLIMQHQENCFASAKITLINPRLSHPDYARKRYARLGIQKNDSDDVEPVFYGCVTAIPARIEKNLIILELLSRPDNAFEKFEKLRGSLKRAPIWDELFAPEDRQDDPTYLLEGISGLYYWDKVTGELSISNINHGREHKIINKIASSNIELKFCSDPLDSVKIKIQAEWVQKSQGIVDLSRLIAKSFADGIVNSFTGNDLRRRFKHLHNGIKNSAYKIFCNDMERTTPCEHSSFYPEYSQSFEVADNGNKRSIKFKRDWFDCKLTLHWRYRQKRREIANITVENSFQKIRNNTPKTKTVILKLRNLSLQSDVLPWIGSACYTEGYQVSFGGNIYICVQTHCSGNNFLSDQAKWQYARKVPDAMPDASLASFFLTPRGQRSIVHAFMVARAHLAWSTRCVEATFRGSVSDLASVTLDMHLTLSCPDLPGGSITGKVVKTLLFADGKTGKQHVDVTVACSVGKAGYEPHLEKYSEPLVNYADQEYAGNGVLECGAQLIANDIEIPDFTSKNNIVGILTPSLLDVVDLVEEAKIINPPEEQESIMNAVKHTRSADTIKQALNNNRTQIFLKLRNINHKTTLEHVINIAAKTPWSAPEGIRIN
ncbi:MAG: hypothetical protein LBI30_01830 [Holosporales bacterium]|jgi:hypothetical protein|nr:hypothetical protein [Holosporales bacterium]